MSSMLKPKDWKTQPRRALSATGDRVASLAARRRAGSSPATAPMSRSRRPSRFANYFETIAFVNALALVAHTQDHHPDLSVHYNRCVVRFNTHDVGGISATDFDCAAQADALLAA